MKDLLFQGLRGLGLEITPLLGTGIILVLIALISLLIHLLLHHVVLRLLERKLLERHSLFNRLALTLQGVILAFQVRIWLEPESLIRPLLELATWLWIVFFALLSFYALLNTVEYYTQRSDKINKLPLRGLFQSAKLLATILALIFALSLLIGKSPVILFSGLGAMTAVLMLVFKDPLMGLVAGIQLAANNMLQVGDWLEMPKYGADGDVVDINLTTVKVRNWDRTYTTVPTYALISDSFKNWRGMQEAGGRRIKRAIHIDATSVRFLDEDDIKRLHKADLLGAYLDGKLAEIKEHNQVQQIDPSSPINGRHLTNLGTFRAYLNNYLKAHPHIHPGLIQMVRQLAPGPDGIPLEVYGFSSKIGWVDYEGIQADIFDHIFAVVPEFGLRVFQNPTGHDLQRLLATEHQNRVGGHGAPQTSKGP